MTIQKRDMQAKDKIMGFLLDRAGEDFYLSQIAKGSKTGVSTCYKVLEKEVRVSLLSKRKLGNLSLYAVDLADPVVRQQKVLRTLELLKPLILKLKVFSKKIILFGSAAEGTNQVGSDIDLFILTSDYSEVREIISGFKLKEKLQVVIKGYLEWVELQKEDKIFYEEVKNGKTLWEADGTE